MNSEFLENDHFRMFEETLRREVLEGRCDFGRVEHELFSNIGDAEEDGMLALLKLDEIVPDAVMERVESGLSKRIEQHIEYEMPVDECIRDARSVHSHYWRYIEHKLVKDIDAVARLSPWEHVVKADEILTLGQWESIEQGLLDALEQPASAEAWETVLMAEEVASLGVLETVETGLDADLDTLRVLPQWEQRLRAGEVPDPLMFARVERGLSLKIGNYESVNRLVRQSLWTYFGFALSQVAKIRTAAATVVACVAILGGYFVYRDDFKTMPIALFQAQGTRLDFFKAPLPSRGEISSEKGGSLTFVTTKGYVELQNGSQLTIKKASEKTVEYVARFADADNQLIGQGNATFFVKHQKKGQRYTVTTHDYRVEVTGTYFMLQPDLGGHVSIAVREGSVSIVFNNGQARRLGAGQMLAYDLNTNAYTTANDGIVVARQDIEQLPDVKDISSYRQLCVATTPVAGVRIDGRFVGMTPLIIMQPQGTHVVSIEKSGYQTLDTSVTLDAALPVSLSLALNPIPAEPGGGRQSVFVYPEISVARPAKTETARRHGAALSVDSAVISVRQASYNENDFGIAEKLEPKNWQKAEELYKQIADNPKAPRLKREAACFSIGKLEAEHAPKKTGAKEAFLNYLALYPTGNFVGESWLRLAELEFGGDQDKAVEYYLKYFEHYPRHLRISELQYRVGLIYLQKKKYDEAIGMLKLALANFQNDNVIDKGKIQTSLYKALKEKDDSQKPLPAATADIEHPAQEYRR